MPQFERDDIHLQVERQIEGKTWWFATQIRRDQWEDLFHVNGPSGPEMGTQAAYDHAQVFWDELAEWCADQMQRDITPGAPNRHVKFVWPNQSSLEHRYTQLQAQREG